MKVLSFKKGRLNQQTMLWIHITTTCCCYDEGCQPDPSFGSEPLGDN